MMKDIIGNYHTLQTYFCLRETTNSSLFPVRDDKKDLLTVKEVQNARLNYCSGHSKSNVETFLWKLSVAKYISPKTLS